MPFDMNAFVNPNQFSDAASIAGFDKPMKGVREAMSEAALAGATGGASEGLGAGGGVAPPDQSFGDAMMDYGKKAIAPYAQKFDQLSNAASQAGQGNFGNAFNAAAGRKVQQPQQAPTPQYDYSHEW